MFKKLLLLTLIFIVGMWSAGYDIVEIKDNLMRATDSQAGAMTGNSAPDNGGWGPDAI
ncbi:hypothetical protein G6N82_10210 [Altererythrobacter sp. BO-6]|uniref:hypothetical protein n=1 Tax=Altererythrobacter sp. BO-6 TaxID=2604537 RepID=UPI0013E1FB28|nr:hypothetical protein [Altererythrobacter sp. BO-6]QIG54474.1 hypothetical protein G6N82_10210 [Altererythrobacter sp. BO-6]